MKNKKNKNKKTHVYYTLCRYTNQTIYFFLHNFFFNLLDNEYYYIVIYYDFPHARLHLSCTIYIILIIIITIVVVVVIIHRYRHKIVIPSLMTKNTFRSWWKLRIFLMENNPLPPTPCWLPFSPTFQPMTAILLLGNVCSVV